MSRPMGLGQRSELSFGLLERGKVIVMKMRLLALAMSGLGLLAAGGVARANSILFSLSSGPTSLGGGQYSYTYDVTLDGHVGTGGQNTLLTGDYGALYD